MSLKPSPEKGRKWSNILDDKVDKQVCYLLSSSVRNWALVKIINARLPLSSALLTGASITASASCRQWVFQLQMVVHSRCICVVLQYSCTQPTLHCGVGYIFIEVLPYI